ncbi:hypothetical protein [Streptacidiphilus jiangxiensis]|uniref:Uncharacterized protein n=1 Tax=Streptacidiphilus jiangxiensis TaxID=235985 RepID=A0A1H7Y8M4_STRJI|nr:hypothetical protein [Streptacidiphilus jiangxiensis]SEM41677.1 hypothetical protein SAMN05414137_12720 [Streptacidiphilus jiangxiensis]
MSLQLPQPPAAALRAVLDALGDPDAPGALPVRSSAMRRCIGPLTPAHPLPVHLLDPALSPGDGAAQLACARRTGWRFLVKDGEEVVAAADTLELDSEPAGLAPGEAHVFSHFAEGPYPAATLRALQQARLHTAGTPTTYLPRLLTVPAHYMTALWLHPVLTAAPTPDLLIPLVPAPLGVTPHIPHHAEELLALLALTSGALLTSTA